MPDHHPAQLGMAPWQCQPLLGGTAAGCGSWGATEPLPKHPECCICLCWISRFPAVQPARLELGKAGDKIFEEIIRIPGLGGRDRGMGRALILQVLPQLPEGLAALPHGPRVWRGSHGVLRAPHPLHQTPVTQLMAQTFPCLQTPSSQSCPGAVERVSVSSLSQGPWKHPTLPQGPPVRTCFQQLGHSFPAPSNPSAPPPCVPQG